MKKKISLPKIDPELYRKFAALVRKNSGLNFSDHSQHHLIKVLQDRISELGLPDYLSYHKRLCQSPTEYRELECLLTTGETYFFRYPHQFDFIAQHVIPEFIKSKSFSPQTPINIWCAGCSTGEEPYSLAILLEEKWKNHWDQFNIIATDLNPNSLKQAQKGQYPAYSFRTKDISFRERFFLKQKKDFVLDQQIKEKVHFKELNLLHLNTSSFDQERFQVIFCRNVLIYFNVETILRVKEMLYRLLDEGGYLVLGHSETWQEKQLSQDIKRCGYSIYQKIKHSSKKNTLRVTTQEPFPAPLIPSPEKSNVAFYNIPIDLKTSVSPLPKSINDKNLDATDDEPIEKFFQKGLEAYKNKDFNLAERLFLMDLQQPTPSKDAMLSLAFLYADQGKLKNAQEYCDRSLNINPLQADGYYLKGMLCRINQQINEAEEHFRRCIYCDKNHIMAHYSIATMLEEQGVVKKAVKAYTHVLELIQHYQPSTQEMPWKTSIDRDEIKRDCIEKLSG